MISRVCKWGKDKSKRETVGNTIKLRETNSHQRAAFSSDCSTPRPRMYIRARSYIACISPCSTAFSNHFNAVESLCWTPLPWAKRQPTYAEHAATASAAASHRRPTSAISFDSRLPKALHKARPWSTRLWIGQYKLAPSSNMRSAVVGSFFRHMLQTELTPKVRNL